MPQNVLAIIFWSHCFDDNYESIAARIFWFRLKIKKKYSYFLIYFDTSLVLLEDDLLKERVINGNIHLLIEYFDNNLIEYYPGEISKL